MFRRKSAEARWRLTWVAAVAIVCFLRPAWGKTAGDSMWGEYRQKANFLAMVPNFVEWPTDTSAAGSSNFPICVFGTYSFGTQLAEATRTTTVHGKRVEVRWVRQETELKACRVVFVSRSQATRYGKVLEALKGTSALTVGETPDFLEAGGMVTLEMQPAGLQFEVNLEAANRARLKISSRLLSLAKRITGHAGAARS